MPAALYGDPSTRELAEHAIHLGKPSSPDFSEQADPVIDIGLLNNTSDAALEATERQFLTLLDSASGDLRVRLSLYALSDIPRGQAGLDHIGRLYSGPESLLESQLDGLIVTGREPLALNLRDEPYWASLTKVIDWAADHTLSTIWSCLAAHAAILHLDGIGRRKSNEKRCGVFECARLSDHELLAGLPTRVMVPHSRWNDIEESELATRGYRLLTRTRNAGGDIFVRNGNSLFAFFQGHPEYESDTLAGEYRRDVARYVRGEADTYPSIPEAYLDKHTEDQLASLREKAVLGRSQELLTEVAAALGKGNIRNAWQPTSRLVYGNWLRGIAARKVLRRREAVSR